jgi:hypothetical protein
LETRRTSRKIKAPALQNAASGRYKGRSELKIEDCIGRTDLKIGHDEDEEPI